MATPELHAPQKEAGLLKAAASMGSATFLSRILGLVRELAFAFLFGASDATDAFNVAFRIPNLLRDLFAEGAMSSALVPTFTQVYKTEGQHRAWRIAGLTFRILFIAAAIVAILGIIFSEPLVRLYASSFESIPGKFALTVNLTRLMYPFFPCIALAAAFMAVLNARGTFFIPAFAPALFNLTSVAIGVAGAYILPKYGHSAILGMAIGVVFGGAVQALFQLPALYRANYRWQPRLPQDLRWYREPALKKILVLMVPGTIALGATQINVLINTILAASQGTGAISYLNYAFRLMQFPIGIFGVSLAVATLPRISAQWIDRDFPAIRHTLTTSLKHVFAINLFASAGLAFLGVPIVQLLFEYGRFRPEDTQSTAAVLAAYSLGLVGYSTVKVLVPACYAVGRSRLAVLSSVLSVCFTIAFNLLMVRSFGYKGLALGTSFSAIFNSVFLFIALKRVLKQAGGDLPFRPLFGCLVSYTLAALVVGAVCLCTDRIGIDPWMKSFDIGSFGRIAVVLSRLLRVGLLGLEAGLLIAGLARIFGLTEAITAFAMVKRRFIKR